MSARVVTFGELMLRLSPPGFERLFQSPMLSATFGGGEANVAVSLAHFGLDSHYVTRLPSHAIGDAAIRALRAEGVVTEAVVRGGSRIGIYFAETGASQRASTVIYDRAHSSISEIAADAVEWNRVMDGAQWFHVTGITPALGEKAVAATQAAISAARRAGARVSVDLNYRKKLWTEAQAQATMRPLMRDVDVVIANEEDLQSVLGVHVAGHRRRRRLARYRRLPGGGRARDRRVRSHNRRHHASRKPVGQRQRLERGAVGRQRRCMHQSQRYVVRLVDRIGGGDSFAAGLIYALTTGRSRGGSAALRRCRERAEADDSWRLQSRLGCGSRRAGQGRRVRSRPALVAILRWLPRSGAVRHGPLGSRERRPHAILESEIEQHSFRHLTADSPGRQVDDEQRLLSDERGRSRRAPSGCRRRSSVSGRRTPRSAPPVDRCLSLPQPRRSSRPGYPGAAAPRRMQPT